MDNKEDSLDITQRVWKRWP